MNTSTGTASLTNPALTAAKRQPFEAADFAVFAAVILAAVGHLTIKAGLVVAAGSSLPAAFLNRLLIYFSLPYVLLGLAIYGIGTAMWILAVSRHDISYVFPISALNYVLVTMGGKVLFAESVPLKRWVGVALVIVGVGLMQSSSRETKP